MNTLEWNASPVLEKVTSYKVYERVGTTYNLTTTVLAPALTFAPPNLAVGAHFFTVSAVNATGESPKSNEVTITVVATLPLPSAPTGLRVV